MSTNASRVSESGGLRHSGKMHLNTESVVEQEHASTVQQSRNETSWSLFSTADIRRVNQEFAVLF